MIAQAEPVDSLGRPARVPVIVESEAAFKKTLFEPIDGRTADGFVIRRGKRFCDIHLAGVEYRLNAELGYCRGFEDGGVKRWTYGNPHFSFGALHDAARALATGRDWSGKEPRYRFDNPSPVQTSNA